MVLSHILFFLRSDVCNCRSLSHNKKQHVRISFLLQMNYKINEKEFAQKILTSKTSNKPSRKNSLRKCILKSKSSGLVIMALIRVMQLVRSCSLPTSSPWTMGPNLSPPPAPPAPFISPAIVMASRVFSWPSGGTKHMAAISFTASCITLARRIKNGHFIFHQIGSDLSKMDQNESK